MATTKVFVEKLGDSSSKSNARGHELIMDRPDTKGGHNQGMMGGEAILSGLGGCFMSNLLAAAKARDIELESARIDIEGDTADSPSRFTAIRMSVSARCNHPKELNKLVTIADRGCIAANTLRAAVELIIKIG